MAERDVGRLEAEVEELFADLWQVPRFAAGRAVFRPQLDCFRTEEPPALTVVVDIAGVDPADIRLEVLPNALAITGERRRPPVRGRVYQLEIDYGPFERRISLAEEVDTAGASASYASGLLTVVLPLARRGQSTPFSVPIDVAADR